MKQFIIVFLIFVLNSCAQYEEPIKSGNQEFSVICIDSVEYIKTTDGLQRGYMSPHLKIDGKPYLCGDKK